MPSQALDIDNIINQVANGAYLRDIARETGIDKRRLSERLRQHPDYLAAKEACHEGRLEDAELALRAAREGDVARAREVWRAIAWRAEREAPHRWGQQSRVTVEHVGSLVERMRAAEDRERARVTRVIEGVAVTVPLALGLESTARD